MTSTDTLFQPFKMEGLSLQNRLVMAPMSRYRCPQNIPTEEMASYYRRRAAGGTGLIISEGTFIAHPSATGYENVPHFYGDEALAGWRHVLAGVHEAGAKMFPQIWHAGSFRQTGMGPDPKVPGFSPSGVLNTFAGNTLPPKAMDKNDIKEVLAAYAESAAAARTCGFDGVEIHGAHGYLIDEFLWAETNQREDQYGGNIENRIRFAVEIVETVRAAVGPGFPVCLRISQWKQHDFAAQLATNPQELEQILLPLAEAGVDIFHGSTRRYWQPEFEGSALNFAGWIRKITGRPTITVGSVGLNSGSFEKAEAAPLDNLLERMEREEFDLVAVGRAMLSEPKWASKIRLGHADTIKSFTGAAIENLY